MSRILKRPMFRMGGSARKEFNKGIITDLEKRYVNEEEEEKANGGRIGYGNGGQTTKERLLEAMGQAPQGQNFNNFLINFGLDLASRSPQGGLISTAALSAKEPFQKFEKASQAEQNLLRQVGLESATLDIGAETAAAAAALKEKSAMDRLTTQIQAEKDLSKGNIDAQILAAANQSIENREYNNYAAATNAADWTFRKSTEYKDKNIGGILSKNDAKGLEKFAKSQGKKQGVGTIYYNPYSDTVYEVQRDEDKKYSLVPISSPSEVPDKNIEATTELGSSDGITNYEYPRGSQELLDQRKGLLDKGRGTIPEQQAGTSSYNIKMTPQQNRDYQEYLKQYKNR